MASNIESPDEIKNGKEDVQNELNVNHASQNCALCGCSAPAVRCDKCSSQIFCLSCDDMYHRHPKRRLHLRKAVDSIWNSHRSPCLRRRTNLPGDPSKIPIPPPRRKRRERYTISGAGLPKSAFEIPPFGTRESWLTRGQNIKSDEQAFDSFASDDSSLPPLPKQQRSSVEQKYKNFEAILQQQNNGINSKAGQTPDSEVAEKMSEEQRQHDSMHSPSSPSQPLQVDMPDGRTFSPVGHMYTRGNQMSHSAAELRSAYFPTSSPQPFFYPHPHPQQMHPHMHPFPHAVPHMNCPQCVTGSWSNMMSPHLPPFHQPWSSAQSTLSRRQQETVEEGHLRQRQSSLPDGAAAYPGPHIPFPPAAFPYVGSPFYAHGYPGAESPLFMDSPHGSDQQRQAVISPSSTNSRQSQGTDKHDEGGQVVAQKTSEEIEVEEDGGGATGGGDEEEVEEEYEEEEVEDEVESKPPEKPVEPWSCVHCTFINPPGSHICMICCKTSYPAPVTVTEKKKKKKKKSEPKPPVSPGDSQKKTDAETEESMQVDSEQPAAMDSEKVI